MAQAPAPAAAPASAEIRSVPAIHAPSSRISLSPTAALTALYAVPAAVLLFITFMALARLVALHARADVLVDGHWLSALARAQRRMGFKHGTALLTSSELSSPISWGLMRPVILLNDRAVEASSEAEAIIAHELAHVARMDWVKLLLARFATALYWFNPFVWLLAREAHQLREETADDAVLAADIADTDYAQLLVGVARHECPGLLLGAHGVAPSRSSLARRVARVLDGASVRAPVARPFALGVFVGAVLVAAPLAALTLTPGGSTKQSNAPQARGKALIVDTSKPYYVARNAPAEVPADLPHIIAKGVSTSVATVVAAVGQDEAADDSQDRADAVADALAEARDARKEAVEEAADEARAEARAKATGNDSVDQLIRMKTAGVTADYVNAMRAAQPRLRSLDPAEFAGIKAVGVTPEYARDLASAGFRNLDANGLAAARAIGLSGEYARSLAAAGVPLDLNDYIQLRSTGIPADYVLGLRRAGHPVRDPNQIIEMWAAGIKPGDLRVISVSPPKPPRPPHTGRPAASPPDWNIPDSGPDG
jgi:beta-lactamase regulating signal transducer with metallopeptidase domain